MLQATDALPMNFGFLGKGNTSRTEGLAEQIAAGADRSQAARGLGHDAGDDRRLPRRSPTPYDVQVAIHTDTLNESGYVDDSIAAFKGRTIHTYHTEGAGGGHAPDIIRVCGEPNVLPSSTNPTRPLHGQHARRASRHADGLPSPRPQHPGGRRVRGEPDPRRDDRGRGRAARPRGDQHDVQRQPGDGAGRRGDLPHLADRAQDEARSAGRLRGSRASNDNLRIRRYIAKYTINPAIAHGVAHEVGSVEAGKLADLVLWRPAFFGVKPELVIKGGFIAWAQMGDANASIPTPQPLMMRPMFGAYGRATGATSLAFVSQASIDASVPRRYGLGKRLAAVRGCRGIGKRDMKLNDALPRITVDPETYTVTADGEVLTAAPARVLPLAQRYWLF